MNLKLFNPFFSAQCSPENGFRLMWLFERTSKIGILFDQQISRLTDRLTDLQTDRQIDGQTYIYTDR